MSKVVWRAVTPALKGSAGQGRSSRSHLDEAGLVNFGHPLIKSDAVCWDSRDYRFKGGVAIIGGVFGGCDVEPFTQDLGLTTGGGIIAGELGLEESGVEGGQCVASVRVSGGGYYGFIAG